VVASCGSVALILKDVPVFGMPALQEEGARARLLPFGLALPSAYHNMACTEMLCSQLLSPASTGTSSCAPNRPTANSTHCDCA
jgi:hypothetical protein